MSLADRLGIEEEAFRRHWGPLATNWRKGQPYRYEEVLEAVCRSAGRAPDRRAIAELAQGTLREQAAPVRERRVSRSSSWSTPLDHAG